MIYLLHGSDWESSYRRLTQIVNRNIDHKIIHLDKSTPQEILEQTLFASSLFPQKEVIILEDLLLTSGDLLLEKSGSPIRKNWGDNNIILWEKREVKGKLLKKLQRGITIELYNVKTTLFEFLDSLIPGSKRAKILVKKQTTNLLWHLQNRLFLLLLAKLGFGANEASGILQKKLKDWQWQKLQVQSSRFSYANLLDFYSGSLKVDFLLKTGKTSLEPSTLASALLLKYLK